MIVATICSFGLVVRPFLPETRGKPLSETKQVPNGIYLLLEIR
jgi:hypothetical protein